MTVTKKDIVELSMAVRWMEEPLNEARRRTVGALLKRMQAHVEEIVEHGMVEDGLSPRRAGLSWNITNSKMNMASWKRILTCRLKRKADMQ